MLSAFVSSVLRAVSTLWWICVEPRWLIHSDNSSRAARMAAWFIISSSIVSAVIAVLSSMWFTSKRKLSTIYWLTTKCVKLHAGLEVVVSAGNCLAHSRAGLKACNLATSSIIAGLFGIRASVHAIPISSQNNTTAFTKSRSRKVEISIPSTDFKLSASQLGHSSG